MYKTRSQSHQRGKKFRNSRRTGTNSNAFEREQERTATIRTLHPGKIVSGEVFKLLDCGALADIGGVVGFIHVSEFSDTIVKMPKDYLKLGSIYYFKIIEIGLNKMGELSTKLSRKFAVQEQI
jgi:ribosomal protein S1